MTGRKNKEGRPQRDMLLPGCLIFFAGVHLLMLIHLGDRIQTRELRVIELSLAQGYPQIVRQIPRPPRPPQSVPENLPMPSKPAAPPKLPPVHRTKAPKPLRSLPPTPATTSVTPPPSAPSRPRTDHTILSGDLLRHYFESVRSKINAHKIYPQSARKRRQEGSVVVRFVISKSGRVTAVRVIGGAASPSLCRAATEAIRRAAPFSPIPDLLGKDQVSTRITIHFKLGKPRT
jgi:periplasmic protein TonB